MFCQQAVRISVSHRLHLVAAKTLNCSLNSNLLKLNQFRNVSNNTLHKPVMVQEVLDIMLPEAGQRYLDMTFGAGGHSKALLEHEPNLEIFALDRDPEAYKLAVEMSHQCPSLVPLLGKFSDITDLLSSQGVEEDSIDGVLFDVGASSMQFDSESRGFALSKDTPLDMRMDKDRLPDHPTAADVLNTMAEDTLSEIIKVYGQEVMAKEIAQAIAEHRKYFGNIQSTKQLADIVSSATRGSYRKNKLKRNAHVATKTFQALRIFVNNELNELYHGLETVHRFLKPGGICIVIVFHSLEERVAKRIFRNRTGIDKDREKYQLIHREPSILSSNCSSNNSSHGHQVEFEKTKPRWKNMSKTALGASQEEMYRNPRSRSARIRGAIKV